MEKTKQWLQMGVELEGSWKEKRDLVASRVRGSKAIDDRSVHIGHGNPGEIVTRPQAELGALLVDISALWPDWTDTSCGFHIHASFTPLAASMIASVDFYAYFKERWGVWGRKVVKLPTNHEFWNRLMGKNKFAVDRFDPERQLSTSFAGQRPEARYTMLNFHSWEKHKTVECRLLPMFADKETGLSAVSEMSDIYNEYLSKHKFENIVIDSPVTVIGDTVVESYSTVTPTVEPLRYEANSTFTPVETGEDVFYAIPGAMNKLLPFNKTTDDQTP